MVLRLALIALVLLTSLSLGMARGQMRAGSEIVLCGGAPVVLYPDDPQGGARYCPDMALGLLAALDLPPLHLRQDMDWLIERMLRGLSPDTLRLSRPDLVTPDLLAAMPLDSVRRVIVVTEGEAEGTRHDDGRVLAAHGLAERSTSAENGALLFLKQDRTEPLTAY